MIKLFNSDDWFNSPPDGRVIKVDSYGVECPVFPRVCVYGSDLPRVDTLMDYSRLTEPSPVKFTYYGTPLELPDQLIYPQMSLLRSGPLSDYIGSTMASYGEWPTLFAWLDGSDVQVGDGVLLDQFRDQRNKFSAVVQKLDEELRLVEELRLFPAVTVDGPVDGLSAFASSVENYPGIASAIFEAKTLARLYFGENCLEFLGDIRRNLFALKSRFNAALKLLSIAIQLAACSFKPIAIYCGFTRVRRAWFLLHGSHPPKAFDIVAKSPCPGGARAYLIAA